MECLDYNVTFTSIDSTSPDWALAKGDIQLESSIVETPTTLQTSTRDLATSTPKVIDTPSNLFPRADIKCFDMVAIIGKSDVKHAFVEHVCNLWDNMMLRSGHSAAVKVEMVELGFKFYLYVGILPFAGPWSYAMESSICTATFMRIVDSCTEVNLLGKYSEGFVGWRERMLTNSQYVSLC